MQKIAIFGSTQYSDKIFDIKNSLEKAGYVVKVPAFDHHPNLSAYEICYYNKQILEWCDLVLFLWDQRSMGAVFDFGMVFMSGKPFKVIYLEKKLFKDVMLDYEKVSLQNCDEKEIEAVDKIVSHITDRKEL